MHFQLLSGIAIMARGKRRSISFLITTLSCFCLLWLAEPKIPQEEVDALQEIATAMGAIFWEFDGDSCTIHKVGLTENPPKGAASSIDCSCDVGNGTSCHVVRITLKSYSLPGILPPQLAKLPYLTEINFAYNYLSGSIPNELGSLQLTYISLLVNRLSGEIPKVLTNITSLTHLCLEGNQLSGVVPSELGNLINLQTLMLSSNNFTGNLPSTFAGLRNLTDFRINDNNFNGTIPDYISNWKQLTRLEMHASGLRGPIPSQISALTSMLQLRISDIDGPEQPLPMVQNMTNLRFLILRNCNLSGQIPDYLWAMPLLEWLDFSFNKFVGRIPDTISLKQLRFIFLTGNLLSGTVPDSILKDGTSVDLSYNNFAQQSSQENPCQQNLNLNLNLFRSSSPINNLSRVVPCMENFRCPHYSRCLLVNCGGQDTSVKESNHKLVYRGDGEVGGGTAKYYLSTDKFWGFSSTGDFMDDNDYQNLHFTLSLQPSNLSGLDSTARIAPITLSYFHYCLENGVYTVSLRFAEILFMNDSTYNSLGRRLFDIYIQDKLVHKDFNIEVAAGGPQKPVVELYNVTVTNNMLDIRLYFAGKGTTRIPRRGIYGPLISAISVSSDLRVCEVGGKGNSVHIIVGVVSSSCLVMVVLLFFLWWKCYFRRKVKRVKATRGLELQTGTFTLKQIEAATDGFDEANKVGQGGFGPVYKGRLVDGTWIAVKQLSAESRQGNREFLNEIGMISCLQHPNLVKLYGCCTQGDELLLVYEYLENNSLARALFGAEHHLLELDWPRRHKICVGIAKGLVFLHEESKLKIVHRDVKATNVLLDQDLNPKISDFGMARLYEQEKTHVTTKVAGTIGYMAPEYALWGHLTYKADVYSFGVVALEIVSGRSNNCFMPSHDCVCLLDWACQKQQNGDLIELIDERLEKDELNLEEVENLVKVAILCTNASPSCRPTMSEVVKMLEGDMPVPDIVPQQGNYTEDLRFRAMRDLREIARNKDYSGSQLNNTKSITENTFGTSSAYSEDIYETTPYQGTSTAEPPLDHWL